MSVLGRRLFLLCTVALLAACASAPPQATVQVFTVPPQLPAGTTYRYERLLSQAAQPLQAELEAAADAMLARAGLQRNDTAARLSLQLAAMQEPVYPWGWGGGPAVSLGIGAGGRGGGVGIGFGFPIGGGAAPASQHVDVLLRDASSGQVVFQSQASASAGLSPAALVQAALRDFPSAPAGVRLVPVANAAAR
jgi:hypothetical protein